MNDDLMLVGSLPYDTAEQAFREIGPRLGRWLPFIPDGEIGDRLYWVNHVAYRVLHGHPDIETVSRPLSADGVELWHGAGEDNRWEFRVKPGVARVRFGDPGWRLGYARDAVTSYFVFKTLRAEGVVPAGVKFQVCLPMPASATRRWMPADDHARVRDGFTEALRLELATICARIPHDDLAIQWDCAIEDTIIEEALLAAGGPTDEVRAVAADLFRPAEVLGPALPGAAALGYHACYGTAGGWPRRSPRDLTGAVLLCNAAVAASGRRVDFLHLPTVASSGGDHAAYMAPLGGLRPAGARVYVGLIHALHGDGGMRAQIEQAIGHLGDIGVAAPCGFGRGPGRMSAASGGGTADLAAANAYMDGLIADHVAAVETLRRVRGA